MSQVFAAENNRYDSMEYLRCGRSGILLPRISLGYWQNFGDTTPLEQQRQLTRRAFDLGITYFDLANNYGPPAGSAEMNFGRILDLDMRPYRDEMIIASKAGFVMWDGPYGTWPSRKNMLASLDTSLKVMGLDYLDIFYAHRPDPRIPIEETVGALATAYQQGKALYVGISNYYTPQEVTDAASALAEWKIPLLVNQVRYSMFDRRIENGVIDALQEVGAGVAVYSPLEQGLLTDRYLDGIVVPGSRASWERFLKSSQITPEYLDTARHLNQLAADRGLTLAQLALAWALRDPQITTALIGASSVKQLEDNVAALDAFPLSETEIARIDRLIQTPIKR